MVGLLVTGVTFVGLDRTSHSVRMVGEPGTDPASTPSPSTTIPDMTVDGSMDESTDSWFHEYDFRTLYPAESRPRCPVVTGKVRQVDDLKVVFSNPRTDDAERALARVRALVETFNERGGVCGVQVDLEELDLRNDSIPTEAVAVLGLPLDPALDSAVSTRLFEEERIAMVGGDGLAIAHHRSERVYPMGTSAAALARTAVQHSAANEAHTFAIVYDRTTQFGQEAATAFTSQVWAVGGAAKASIGIDPGAVADIVPSRQFKQACGDNACDMVFLALGPDAAAKWLLLDPPPARLETTALPTLLSDSFSDACLKASNRRCNGVSAWSGFVPRFDDGTESDQRDALDALQDDPKLDVPEHEVPEHEVPAATGALVEATVAGTHVLLKALLEAGPAATRSVVWETLEAESFTSRLPVSLRWGPDGLRTGNPVSQAWRLSIDSVDTHNVVGRSECTKASTHTDCVATTRVWRPVGTGWLQEPR